MNLTTMTTDRTLKPWLMFFSIGVFSLAMVAGMWKSVELVTADLTDVQPLVVHRTGRVAGATVTTFQQGPVTVQVSDGINPRKYQIDVTEPLSIANLFRVANKTTSLQTVIETDANGIVRLKSVGGVAAPKGKQWNVLLDGTNAVDLNQPVLQGGSAVELTFLQQ